MLLLGSQPLAAALTWGTNMLLAQQNIENKICCQKKEICWRGREVILFIRIYIPLLRTILMIFLKNHGELRVHVYALRNNIENQKGGWDTSAERKITERDRGRPFYPQKKRPSHTVKRGCSPIGQPAPCLRVYSLSLSNSCCPMLHKLCLFTELFSSRRQESRNMSFLVTNLYYRSLKLTSVQSCASY